MQRINVAVVGVGYWGPGLVRNFLKIPEVNMSIICDLDRKKLEKFSREYKSIKTTTNFQKIIRDKSIAIVAIATPTSTHYELAKKALSAGKHVLIEDSMQGLARKTISLLKNPQLAKKIGEAGQKFVKEKFDWKAIVEMHDSIYKDVKKIAQIAKDKR